LIESGTALGQVLVIGFAAGRRLGVACDHEGPKPFQNRHWSMRAPSACTEGQRLGADIGRIRMKSKLISRSILGCLSLTMVAILFALG